MKPVKIIKILIDIAMTVLFLLLMGYHLLENETHEWIGVSLFVLFIAHNALNFKWYKALFKGRYNVVRIIRCLVNFALFVFMLLAMISGIMLSREVFGFLGITAGMTGRRLHLIATAWVYLLMSMHLGFHWGTVVGATRKMMGKALKRTLSPTIAGKVICGAIAAGISCYGIYAFIERGIADRLFLLIEYAFFDFYEPPVFFYMDYIAILVLFATIAYYLMQLIRLISNLKRKKAQKNKSQEVEQ